MKHTSMISFKGILAFDKFIYDLDIYGDWKIHSGLMNDRGRIIANKRYVKELQFLFNSKNLFHKKVSVAETVSWLDTFVHLQRIFTILKLRYDKQILNELEIIFEYVIEMSKLSRVDVVLKYRSGACLFEFSTVNSFERIKRAYQQKRVELMIYKDLMMHYLPNDVKIYLYPFVGLYEYDNNERNEAHYHSNVKQAEFAAEYISKFLINNYCIQFH